MDASQSKTSEQTGTNGWLLDPFNRLTQKLSYLPHPDEFLGEFLFRLRMLLLVESCRKENKSIARAEHATSEQRLSIRRKVSQASCPAEVPE